LNSQELKKDVFNFLVGGVPGLLVHLGVLLLLTKLFHVGVVTSSMVGVIPSFFVNFCVYKFWSFKNDKPSNTLVQLILAFIVTLSYIVLGGGLMYLIHVDLGMGKIWAQIVVKIGLGPLSFFATRSVFKQ